MFDIMEDVDKIFWDKTTHARDFIDDISKKLEDNKNIILNSSDEIPWFVAFHNAIKQALNLRIGEKYDDSIKLGESKEQALFEDKNSIKKSLLDNRKIFDKLTSCSRESREIEFVQFFAKNAFTHNKNNKNFYIWLELYSEKSFYTWVDFISDYIKTEDKSNKNIVFIISYHQDIVKVNYNIQSNFKRFLFKEYINWYDCYVFFATISNSKNINLNEYFKLYLAELLTNIVRENITGKVIEFCIDCLKDYDNFIKNPYSKITSIFSKCKIEKDVKEIIYRSQIRVFYPMLNEFRVYYFTKKYKEKLQTIIDNDNDWLIETCEKKHEVVPKEPKYFQFGTLKQCGKDKKIIYDYNDKDALIKYGDARNDLSHIDIVKFSSLIEIIDIFNKKVR